MKKIINSFYKLGLIIVLVLLSQHVKSQNSQLPYLKNVELKVKVVENAKTNYYLYEYTIYNSASSTGKINDFKIDVSSSLERVAFDTTGLKFKDDLTRTSYHRVRSSVQVPIIEVGFPSFPLYEDAGLSIKGMAVFSSSLVEAEEKQEGFILMSKGLPGVREFIASPQYDPSDYYPSVDEVETMEEIKVIDSLVNRDYRELPYRGNTIGPVAPPKNFLPNQFVDTLKSYLNSSCDTDWIENQGICNSLEVKLDNVGKQLQNDNNKTAANNLQAFLNELDALKEKQISSEAYALLYFNGKYLLNKLQSTEE